jgi:hypothetical protein
VRCFVGSTLASCLLVLCRVSTLPRREEVVRKHSFGCSCSLYSVIKPAGIFHWTRRFKSHRISSYRPFQRFLILLIAKYKFIVRYCFKHIIYLAISFLLDSSLTAELFKFFTANQDRVSAPFFLDYHALTGKNLHLYLYISTKACKYIPDNYQSSAFNIVLYATRFPKGA